MSISLQSLYLERYLGRFTPRKYKSANDISVDRTPFDLTPIEAVIRYKRVTVLGPLGSGKSTILRFLALSAVGDDTTYIPTISLYLELQLFARSTATDLLQFLLEYISSHYHVEISYEELTQLCEDGELLLLLDGLDEVSADSDVRKLRYDFIIEQINQLAFLYPKLAIVVGSRDEIWQDRLDAFHTFQVDDLRINQIEQFIDNWFEPNATKSRELFLKLRSHDNLLTLAKIPLFLAIICVLHDEALEVSANFSELYGRFIQALFQEWNRERPVIRESKLTDVQKIELLSEIAWHLHSQGRSFIDEADLLNLIREFLLMKVIPKEFSKIVLNEFQRDYGIIIQSSLLEYRFFHQSFQDYFTSIKLSTWNTNRLHALVGRLKFDPWWRNVIIIMAELTNCSDLIYCILDLPLEANIESIDDITANDDFFFESLILVTECAANSLKNPLPFNLRQKIYAKLWELLSTSPYPLDWERTIKSLLKFSDPNIERELINLLNDSSTPLEKRHTVVECFGKMYAERLGAVLLDFLEQGITEETPHDAPPRLKSAMSIALANLPFQQFVPRLVQLFEAEKHPWIKGKYAVAIARTGDTQYKDRFFQLLSEQRTRADIRWGYAPALLEALLLCGNSSIAPVLFEWLVANDTDPVVKICIPQVLGTFADDKTHQTLINAILLDSLDWQTKWLVTEALEFSRLTDRATLAPFLYNEQLDLKVRIGIAATICALGGTEGKWLLKRSITEWLVPSDFEIRNFSSRGFIWERIIRILIDMNDKTISTFFDDLFDKYVDIKNDRIERISYISPELPGSLQGVLYAAAPFKSSHIAKGLLAAFRSMIPDLPECWRVLPDYMSSQLMMYPRNRTVK